MENRLDVEVSCFEGVKDVRPKLVNLYDFLVSNRYKSLVDEIRSCVDEKKRKDLKLKLPAITPSGSFSVRKSDALIEHSKLICIDIDKKSNLDVENFSELKELIITLDCVAYCGLSVSGEGYFVLIPILYPNKHIEYFKGLQRDFAASGLTIDPSCRDVSRLRFASYDDYPYINKEAKVYDRFVETSLHLEEKLMKTERIVASQVTQIISVISSREIDITGGYDQWFGIGCSLANEFGEGGREMFHAISKYGNGYDWEDANFKFDEALKNKYNYAIGTFFHYAKLSGVELAFDIPEAKEDFKSR